VSQASLSPGGTAGSSALTPPAPKVQVLLASFNGADYIDAQLQSLFRQTLKPYSVLVRDDRSTDGTLAILDIWEKREPSLTVYRGSTNAGVINSFFELLKRADDSADYIALCDQDDVWLPQKLARATEKLGKDFKSVPALFFSRLQYVDKDLIPVGQSLIPRELSLESALVENVATGCTVVINQALRQILLEELPTRNCLMHDWWLYLLAHAFGEVVYDQTPTVFYRQHGGNVVGASASFMETYKTKVKRFRSRGQGAAHIGDQAEEFLKCYGAQMSPMKATKIRHLLAARTSFFARLKLAITMPYRRQRWLDTQILRILILLGKF